MYIKASVDTWVKRRTEQSSALTDEEKFHFDKDSELDINWAKSGDDNHWICELAKPKLGFFNWYFFKSHVELLDGQPLDALTILLSKDKAEKIFGRTINPEDFEDLNRCLSTFKIDTPRRIAAFCSQIGHESAGLRYREEIASGAAYEGRTDLGNTKPGDGRKFKGAGFLQVTGRFNYQKLANAVHAPNVMSGVSYVAEKYPFTSAGFWWKDNNMNKLVDKGTDIDRIGARVNGRYLPNGYKDRRRYWKRACSQLGITG